MKLPNGHLAQIEHRKLTEYALSLSHPHGRTHAILFKRLLDLDAHSALMLQDALLLAAQNSDAIATEDQGFGQKYEVRFQMTGPRGSFTVLSVWIMPHNDLIPRLVTTYIE